MSLPRLPPARYLTITPKMRWFEWPARGGNLMHEHVLDGIDFERRHWPPSP
jgi:hypothetical protein